MVCDEEVDDSYVGVLYLQHKNNLLDLEGFLVHENSHLAQDILEFKGIEHKAEEANEPYATLEQWLYKENVVFIRECYNKLINK